jgi:AcrR family transcriptional regulator
MDSAERSTRDAAASRARILDAAVAEFAAHGMAGARVDRIAAAAQLNKSLLYAYVGSKAQLFDAAFAHAVGALVDEVPLDGADLAAYAVALHDRYVAHPEVVRLALWDRLERGGDGLQAGPVAEVEQRKVEHVRAAQRSGLISDRLSAEQLVAVLTVVAAMSHLLGAPSSLPGETERQRELVRQVIASVAAPER